MRQNIETREPDLEPLSGDTPAPALSDEETAVLERLRTVSGDRSEDRRAHIAFPI